jgi:sugar diacid utilization regulator
VETFELRLGDDPVGRLRLRARSAPSPAALSLVRTLIATEALRVQAAGRASGDAAGSFLRGVLRRELTDPADVAARAGDLGIDLNSGASVVVARAHPRVPTDEDWRARVLSVAERGARAAAPGSIAALAERSEAHGGEVVILVPGGDDSLPRRLAEGVLRELEAGLPGFGFSVGRSRVARAPEDLHRAGNEALLAANVADAASGPSVIAFEETGAYRLLLPAMSEGPEELQRFYGETLEPVVAYDEQYSTDLAATLEAFLECDGNVAQTAQRLYTHRHTVRYRLERVRELTGFDVGSSDGRERLSLGLKAMRVLGIAAPSAPASEAGTEAGRVPREPKDR